MRSQPPSETFAHARVFSGNPAGINCATYDVDDRLVADGVAGVGGALDVVEAAAAAAFFFAAASAASASFASTSGASDNGKAR